MIDLSSLVKDGVVQAGAMMFPVQAIRNSAGIAPTKFILVQVPDTGETPEWVACVWKSNQTTGMPELIISEKVTRIASFETSNITVVLENSGTLTIKPDGGCGCGTRLRSFQPWGAGVHVYQGSRPTVS